MNDAPETPQTYLITPAQFDLSSFPEQLSAVLDACEVACLRLDLATRDESDIMRAADTLRAVTEPRDIALVVADHVHLAQRTGLDGVHLSDGARNVRTARKVLGADAIVGAFCGISRHDGMAAGEAGADYVAFGPAGQHALGTGDRADADLFAWWSEMIEIPVVAEGIFAPETSEVLASITDFIALGEEIWSADTPIAALQTYQATFC